jgi:hypothetical protein
LGQSRGTLRWREIKALANARQKKTAVPIDWGGGFRFSSELEFRFVLANYLRYAIIRRASGRIFPVVIGFLYGTLCGVN